MGQHRKYHIRSPDQLISDREQQPSVRRRAAAMVFGMYLPLLTDITTPLATSVYETSQHLVRERRGPSATMRPNNNFGLTFAERHHVGLGMRNMLGQGFVLQHLIDRLQDTPTAVGNTYIDVPIIGFAWKGVGKRKLAAELDASSAAYRALCEQALEIESVLGAVRGTNNMQVALPDHVTVAAYGHPGDGMSLSRTHRGEVAELFDITFLNQNDGEPLSLRLGSLVVGEHYKKPFYGMELTPLLPVFVDPSLDEELELMALEPVFS